MDEEEEKKEVNECERCHSRAAVFQQYDLKLCRRCFREIAPKMGFKKYE